MTLCQSCQNFNIYKLWGRPAGSIDLRLKAVKEAASYCDFCSLLYEQFERKIKTHRAPSTARIWISLVDDSRNRGNISKPPQFSSILVRLARTDGHYRESDKAVRLGIVASPNSPAANGGHFIGRYLGDDPGSPYHFSAILQWLSECLKHPACSRHYSGTTADVTNSALPTRCIELLENNEFQLSETRATSGSYITLSHRWTDETATSNTTTHNYEKRKAGGGWDNLTKTFRDAIEVTRKLGIKYIWIDSICIIQSGDTSDWATEAAEMATYYQNSIMTIAVVDSSPEHGFLAPRKENTTFKRLVQLPYFDGRGVKQGNIFVFKPEFDPSKSHYKTYESGLLTRGWVFQEWLLSRRIVYFTEKQLVFECQSKPPENEGKIVIFGEDNSRYNDYWAILKIRYAITEELKANRDKFYVWYFMIERYCQQQLTRPEKDYAVAIIGIAREFRDVIATSRDKTSTQLTFEYAAGLWAEDIHFGLLWQVKDKTIAESATAQTFQAPSWSWCSISLPIIWLPRRARTTDVLIIQSIKADAQQDQASETQIATGNPNTTPWFRQMPKLLRVKGHLTKICIGCYPDKEQLMTIAVSAGHEEGPGFMDGFLDTRPRSVLHPHITESWRIISPPLEPDVISGYGTFERPKIQSKLRDQQCTEAFALHVSTTNRVGHGAANGYASRALGLGVSVYNVLFLEQEEDGKYGRVGVGAIFDQALMNILKTGAEQEIDLV